MTERVAFSVSLCARKPTWLLVLALLAAFASPAEPADFPAAGLAARVEANLAKYQSDVRDMPSHAVLVSEVEAADLMRFMRQIEFHADEREGGFALGVAYGPEMHGGGVLALLFEAWRPDGRAARMDDAFVFEANGRALELKEIYRGYQRQIFLPVPGRESAAIEGTLPATPQLARMRFHYPTEPGPVERDAYKFLGLLVAHEPDPTATWRNHPGQELSVDLLMRGVRGHYLTQRDPRLEVSDHSNLHLVELLLAYDRRRPDPAGTEALKKRFLEVELAREEFKGKNGSEALAHYVESLGVLLADPRVTFQPSEKAQIRAWLGALEQERFVRLETMPLQHRTHLARGLRLIRAHADRLE